MKLEARESGRKSPLSTANLHAMVTFGGVLLAVVVVVVAGLPGVERRGPENSQIWGVIFFIMKLIKKVKELKGFGASAAHGPFWGSPWGEGRGRKGARFC